MQEMPWADRGRQLRFEAGEPPVPFNRCLGLARLGGAAVPAPLFSVWIQLRGNGWVEAREGRFDLGAGDWIMLERDSAPQVQVGGHGLCIGLLLDGEALASLEALADVTLYTGRGHLSRAQRRSALRLWREAAPGGDVLAVRPLLLYLASVQRELAARVRHCPGRSRSHKRQVFGRMQRALLYLEGNSDRVVRIDEVARLANFSSWYFSKAFHVLYGESPQSLSARLRLERAAGLLQRTSMMVGEVAAASGFDNSCSFARAFRARYGVTATRYRQQRQHPLERARA
ncbi:MAG: helix-turn-helix transcriptional regulator [Luteimonas sp.]